MAKARILIVEDEKIIALDLQRRLEKFDYRVVALAATADDAVAAAEQYRPDIVLMDIMLGGERDGIDAAVDIRNRFAIPIVFLTAYADERTVERAKQAEPVGYVLKPFKERELQTTLDIALYKARVDRKLREQEELFEALLNSIADALIATTADGAVRFMNPPAQALTGWHEERAIDQPIHEVFRLFDETTEPETNIPFASLVGGKSIDFDNVFLLNELGARINVSGTVSSVQQDGREGGFLISFRDVTDIRQMSRIIEYQASHDSLTGLMNREEFFNRLKELAADALANHKIHSFLYVDLDQFKVVNDVCGHAAGDELLRQVSTDTRTIAAGSSTLMARLGGDEFGLVLLDTPLNNALMIAKTLLRNLDRKFIWQKNAFHITASIGVVPIAGINADAHAILAAADDACYLAKEAGGNAIKVYENADYTFLKRRGEMQWISRLTHALEDNRFELWGQQILPTDGSDEQVYEVLLRLRDTNDELISPGDFIPAAEKYNLMPAIDRWVLLHAMRFLVDGFKELEGDIQLSINLSAASIADETMLAYIKNLLDTTGVDAGRICLEITETTAIANMTRAGSFMKQLKRYGVTFALDDFGNGFSSFAYLKSLPVDYLKIDGSFVKGVATDPIDFALVEAVNMIGHTMGLKTIAEYVKDDAVRTRVEQLGVDYLQGYQIAKPIPLR